MYIEKLKVFLMIAVWVFLCACGPKLSNNPGYIKYIVNEQKECFEVVNQKSVTETESIGITITDVQCKEVANYLK